MLNLFTYPQYSLTIELQPKFQKKIGILRGFDQFGTIPTENDSYEILIKTSSRVVLASILWKIAFNADYQACLRIGETFKVIFTEKGLFRVLLDSLSSTIIFVKY